MADAFSGYVTEWHGGRTRAYVNAYVESETDKTATIYVSGCAQATNISQYGVKSSCTGGGSGSGILNCASGTADYASCSARFTVNKGSGHYETCSCTIWGETVNGYGPISGSVTASVSVWVGAKVLRPPSAPSGLVAQRSAAGVIALSWSNNASNASSTLIERKPYGGDWSTIIDSNSVFATYSDSVGTGTYMYRVRYWNGDGFSGYSNESEWITALCAPAAPTLVTPASGSTVNANDGNARLTWRHNSLDTSPQLGAMVRWSFDGGATWSNGNPGADADGNSAQHLDIAIEPNSDVQWQVRTRGAYNGGASDFDEYSPWSAVSMFRVRTPPSAAVSVTSPVRAVPVTVSWTYDDAIGSQASALVEVLDASGIIAYSKQVTTQKNLTIQAAEFTPVNYGIYTVRVTVTSTTSLMSSATASFSVEYEPPAEPTCSIAVDNDAASVSITVYDGNGPVSAQYISVFRDGEPISSNMTDGGTCVDETPPLDSVITYRVVACASSGAVSECERRTVVDSRGYVYFNFGAEIFKALLNMTRDDATEGERVIRPVASSAFPKVFFGTHKSRTGSITADVMHTDVFRQGGKALIEAAELLKEYNGSVFMRKPGGVRLLVVCNTRVSLDATRSKSASVVIDWEAVSP